MSSEREKAFNFLNHHQLGILGTASSTSDPWGSAVYYVVNEKLDFYFITHIKTLKYRNIQLNHRASLTVVDDKTQTTVQAAGDITEVDDTSVEYSQASGKLALVRPPGEVRWTPPVSKMPNGETVLLRLRPTSLQFADFDNRQAIHDSAQKII